MLMNDKHKHGKQWKIKAELPTNTFINYLFLFIFVPENC